MTDDNNPTNIRWDQAVAWIGNLSIGEVWVSESTGEHWFGYVEGIGRIGTCASEQDAMSEVERLWKAGKR